MALTADYSPHPTFEYIRGVGGGTDAMPVYATADEYYRHALIGEASGLVAPLGAVNADKFVGICKQRKTLGASSGSTIPVNLDGVVWKSMTVAGATAATDKGRTVFCASDDAGDATLTPPGDYAPGRAIGVVHKYISTGVCDVAIYPYAEQGNNIEVLGLGAVTMSAIGSYDQTVNPGRNGRLLAIGITVTTVTTDADAQGVFTPTVDGTAVTGTLTTTDTAGGTNTMTDDGKTYWQSLSGAGCVFTAGAAIRVAGTQTTAYSDGAGTVVALVEYYN